LRALHSAFFLVLLFRTRPYGPPAHHHPHPPPPIPAQISTLAGKGIEVPLPGIKPPLFTHSFLGLGMDAAQRRAVRAVLEPQSKLAADVWDPCLPVG
jgi:hypothetical protein